MQRAIVTVTNNRNGISVLMKMSVTKFQSVKTTGVYYPRTAPGNLCRTLVWVQRHVLQVASHNKGRVRVTPAYVLLQNTKTSTVVRLSNLQGNKDCETALHAVHSPLTPGRREVITNCMDPSTHKPVVVVHLALDSLASVSSRVTHQPVPCLASNV